MSEDKRHLHYLHELSKYSVDDNDPDVRGWHVVDASGRTVGKVDNFLVNKDAMRVRYLDVEVDKSVIDKEHAPLANSDVDGTHQFINKEGHNHVILPIGMVRLDNGKNQVHTDSIDSSTFDRSRRIEKNKPIDPEYEVYVVEHFSGTDTGYKTKTTDEAFYNRKEFSTDNYRK